MVTGASSDQVLFRSKEAMMGRDRFMLRLTHEGTLVLELKHPGKKPTTCKVGKFPEDFARAVQEIVDNPRRSLPFVIQRGKSLIYGRLTGKAHEEPDCIIMTWNDKPMGTFVAPAELQQLVTIMREHFTQSSFPRTKNG